MSIKVNTAAIANSANKIATYNSMIDNNFSSVVQAVNSLDRTWESGVSSMAVNAFHNIYRVYPESRYRVIDDMKRFMIRTVGDGYENVETAVNTAANAFK